MKNPFGKNSAPVGKPNRNAFDLSHQTLFTMQFGRLYPVFCEEVIPGDSFKINPSAVINSMPTLFPINTRIRANLHFFYVRNRTLWKDWEDFIFNTKSGLTAPYLSITSSNKDYYLKTGSLGDFLGLPTSFYGDLQRPRLVGALAYGYFDFRFYTQVLVSGTTYRNIPADSPENKIWYGVDSSKALGIGYTFVLKQLPLYNSGKVFRIHIPISTLSSPQSVSNSALFIVLSKVSDNSVLHVDNVDFTLFQKTGDTYFCYADVILSDDSWSILSDSVIEFGELQVSFVWTGYSNNAVQISGNSNISTFFPALIPANYGVYLQGDTGLHDGSEDGIYQASPFLTSNSVLRVSALPFRAYEMVMNYFYRNDVNNPYYINGEVQYNEFIPTHEGGLDQNIYDFHNRNWELDRFTSAVPNPQFGDAPLVGITYSGGSTATLYFAINQDAADQGEILDTAKMSTKSVKVGIDDDGVIRNIIDFDKGVPSGSLRNVMDLSTYGISINDLRNVNSFQRFLENTMRRGLRYRNQLLSHMGVSVDYPDIDVPQFIGGCSSVLGVREVTNTAASENFALGDFNARFVGELTSGHDIRCYTPEHGFIIGIMSLSPVPTYPQVCKKYLLKHSPFDYFQQEFSKIGYVPINYSELSPLQSNDVDGVFGYQRAWYDYLQNLDEVHSDFRLSLKDFVLTRIFGVDPQLSADFTKIKVDQLNDIWATDSLAEEYGSSAQIFVQMFFSVIAKRQIPRYGIPRLE